MIGEQNTSENISSLLVLANNEHDFLQIQSLLCTYFPSAMNGHIHLDTKYYLADVRILRHEWPNQAQIAMAEPINEQQASANTHKQDLLIMLANDSESFSSETYDYVINKYNPENYILIVNTKDKLIPWIDEERITNQVNNFIEIIKENLVHLNQNPPQRTKKGLLTDSYEDGNIFNLLQLIETTPWSHITRKNFERNEKSKINPQAQSIDIKQPLKTEQKVEKKQQSKPEPQALEEEMTDQQLQSEMNAFESLMSEMMNLRATSTQPQKISDNDRKRKAEDLMNKLLGGWM